MPLLPWYQMLRRILDIGTKPVWKDEARSRMGRRRESGVEIQAPESEQDADSAAVQSMPAAVVGWKLWDAAEGCSSTGSEALLLGTDE